MVKLRLANITERSRLSHTLEKKAILARRPDRACHPNVISAKKEILLDKDSHFWENALGLFTSNDNLVDASRLKSSLLRHENAHNEARRNTL